MQKGERGVSGNKPTVFSPFGSKNQRLEDTVSGSLSLYPESIECPGTA